MPALPLRRNAHNPDPVPAKRWNAMFADSGARNLAGQMALHAEMCDDGVDCLTGGQIGNVHYSPDFVLWHRAFLYYHEQILGVMGDGTSVGLPYWEWSGDRLCPPAYDAAQFDFRNHLMHSKQELSDENFAPQQIAAVVAALRSMPPDNAAVEMFDEPIHAIPHNRFGWDRRSDLMTAAGDPLFYGHHGNLDRLATHIFEKGWPKPTGISYHFVGPDGKQVCTKLDRFAGMSSPYEGDQPIDTSGYQVTKFEGSAQVPPGSYSRVRLKLRFRRPVPNGLHQLISGKGRRVGEIASNHHGTTKFILWLSPEDLNEGRSQGLLLADIHEPAEIDAALLVTSPK
ncbi:MAG TPA: tyrosinase family protein [Candidatus Solibacter sp.]